MTYPLLNFNGTAVEVLEWICNFIPRFTAYGMIYPCWNKSYSLLIKGVPGGKDIGLR